MFFKPVQFIFYTLIEIYKRRSTFIYFYLFCVAVVKLQKQVLYISLV